MNPQNAADRIDVEHWSVYERQQLQRFVEKAVTGIKQQNPAQGHRQQRHEKAHPKGELDYVNAFTLLVAAVLSAQATDLGVNKATRALFAGAGSPAKMAALGEEKLQDMIKTIGLYRTKAKNVIALSQRERRPVMCATTPAIRVTVFR